MSTRLLRLLAALFALSLVAAACGDDDDDTTAAVDETTDEATDAEAAMEPGTVVEVAAESGEFPTLVAAIEAAGLAETLSGEGPFTVLAPSEDAFAALLEELGVTADELLENPDLESILTYHVLPVEAPSDAVIDLAGEEVETVNGASVMISVDGDTVMVNDATVVQTDIEASNGVIHVIDQVLLPPSM